MKGSTLLLLAGAGVLYYLYNKGALAGGSGETIAESQASADITAAADIDNMSSDLVTSGRPITMMRASF